MCCSENLRCYEDSALDKTLNEGESVAWRALKAVAKKCTRELADRNEYKNTIGFIHFLINK
jgi:hypothetical protein